MFLLSLFFIIFVLGYPCLATTESICNSTGKSCNYELITKTEVSNKSERSKIINYPLNKIDYLSINVPENSSVKVQITSIERNFIDFLVIHAHSQIYAFSLRNNLNGTIEEVNGTNPALVILLSKYNENDPIVIIENNKSQKFSVVLLVRNYTHNEPIPGGLYLKNSSEPYPHPFLTLNHSLLTTWLSFPLATPFEASLTLLSFEDNGFTNEISLDLIPSLKLKYVVYLSYLYEGDMTEEHFLKAIVEMSTVESLQESAKEVADIKQFNSLPPELLFVSYSGVGAVVNILASFNGSKGVLYSTAIFYGCDFIPGEEYNCTKLVSTFAKLVCACFPFLGFILLFAGHRWLNFTMFVSGLLASWFLIFITFIRLPNVNTQALGVCTLIGAIVCGIGWLTVWHKHKRPFFSALLLIILGSLFAAMISTHFLKYAMVPSRHNIAAFIVFPVAFALLIVIYSVFDIKKTHIFSCGLLGSYLVIVPLAFYFGSSLTYIVINIVSLVAVSNFSEALGYPPFQQCDIILLCIWIALFFLGSGYQFYRERLSPPFYPPSSASLRHFIRLYDFLRSKMTLLFYDEFGARRPFKCCSDHDDFGSYGQINSSSTEPLSSEEPTSWPDRARSWRDYFRKKFPVSENPTNEPSLEQPTTE